MNFSHTLIDLTHELHPDVPAWNAENGFCCEIQCDYAQCKTNPAFRIHKLKMHAGIGTHMDAPAHCMPRGNSIDRIPLPLLISPCVVIDVTSQAHERYSVTPEDILSFEHTYGPISEDTFVAIRTGWERFWNTPERYRNNHIFPSVTRDAALLLLTRGVRGLGIDTLSPDRPEDGFPVHETFLGAGKYIVENIANSGLLPPIGSIIACIPLNLRGATESPIRLIGMIPKQHVSAAFPSNNILAAPDEIASLADGST